MQSRFPKRKRQYQMKKDRYTAPEVEIGLLDLEWGILNASDGNIDPGVEDDYGDLGL